jgi:hypothetical protein
MVLHHAFSLCLLIAVKASNFVPFMHRWNKMPRTSVYAV